MILAERGIERSFCRLSIFSLPWSLLPGDLQGLSAGNGVRHILGVAHHHGVGSPSSCRQAQFLLQRLVKGSRSGHKSGPAGAEAIGWSSYIHMDER